MFVDLGYASRAECPLRIGDEAVFVQPFLDLGKRLVGKALDDRIGVALLVEGAARDEGAKNPIAHTSCILSSACKSRWGGAAQSRLLMASIPTWDWSIDATPSADTPSGISRAPGWARVRRSGCGMEARCSTRRWWIGWWRTAQAARLPYQWRWSRRRKAADGPSS